MKYDNPPVCSWRLVSSPIHTYTFSHLHDEIYANHLCICAPPHVCSPTLPCSVQMIYDVNSLVYRSFLKNGGADKKGNQNLPKVGIYRCGYICMYRKNCTHIHVCMYVACYAFLLRDPQKSLLLPLPLLPARKLPARNLICFSVNSDRYFIPFMCI